MTKRENLIRAIKRQNPEYVPHFFTMCDSQIDNFKTKTGKNDGDYMSYFDMPLRFVDILPSKYPVDYSRYFTELPEGAIIDEWGVAHKLGSFKHFSKMIHPMESFTTPEEVWSFPLPDILADYRWEGFEDRVRKVKEEGFAAMFSAVQIFEPAWYLRGMENLLIDMMTDEEMATACIERITRIQEGFCAKLAKAGIDIIVYGDDVGTQKSLMMSIDLWRKFIRHVTIRVIKAAKDINPDVICYYHSDGVINDIIPELIEIGVDVLNPVQPECMDPVEIKRLYGDRLSFWGTVGTQTTMPFGTSEDVENNVKHMIETVGKGGGLVIAPTHLLEPEVPWENILAFVEAVKKYGRY